MLTISSFKDILASKAGGKPISKIPNFYSMLYQAMIMVKGQVDLPSSIRTQQLVNPIYSDVDYYVVPADLGMMAIINLRPITPDGSYYDYSNFSQRQFTIENKFDTPNSFTRRYAIKYQDGTPYILISGIGEVPVVINNCESLTANGTWGALGVASNVELDTVQKYSGNGCISFKVNIGSAQGLQNSNMTAIDLTNEKDVFYAVYLPTITGVTGVRLGLGQSAGAYYTATSTVDFFGNTLHTGWNLISVPKTSFTAAIGSPTWTGVVFAQYEVLGTFAVGASGFKFDNLVANVGVLMEFDYYSDYSFASSSMAFKAIPTTDSDYIVMDGTELPLLINQFTEIMAVDLKQAGASVDYSAYGGKNLKDQYDQFKIDYPSQRQLMITKYSGRPRFDMPDSGMYLR